MKYCTYLTVYRGNRLPPFYIGHTRIDKIIKGYHGSVCSKRYKDIWVEELRKNQHLFHTKILTLHPSKKQANEREQSFQKALKVIGNPLYANMGIGGTGLLTSRKWLNTLQKNKKNRKEKRPKWLLETLPSIDNQAA